MFVGIAVAPLVLLHLLSNYKRLADNRDRDMDRRRYREDTVGQLDRGEFIHSFVHSSSAVLELKKITFLGRPEIITFNPCASACTSADKFIRLFVRLTV